MNEEIVHVECYAGHRFASEPRAFEWQGQRWLIARVESTWRTPEGLGFRVQTDGGRRFELWYQELADPLRYATGCPPEAPLGASGAWGEADRWLLRELAGGPAGPLRFAPGRKAEP